MLANLLAGQYDSYQPGSSDKLVKTVTSYINTKSEDERRTPEFVAEIHRSLYFIHEHNSEVYKLTYEYPRTRQFDLLLIKYVELEFDALYHINPFPPQQFEIDTKLRVSRLLHVMLYQAVLNNGTLITKHSDQLLRTAVLQLLSEVKSTSSAKNIFVYNNVNSLIKEIQQTYNSNDTLCNSEICKNLATSDYGTDSDSENENRVFVRNCYSANQISSNSDALSNEGISVPTIEFADQNYLNYLPRQVLDKRKVKGAHNSNNLNVAATKSKQTWSNNLKKSSKDRQNKNTDSTCVILSSDSEDEVAADNKIRTKRKNCDSKAKLEKPGVVTFEIIDDDDAEVNYMVYLQKEVETNKKPKRQENVEEVIICSDSEEDQNNVIQKSLDTQNTLLNSQSNIIERVVCKKEESDYLDQIDVITESVDLDEKPEMLQITLNFLEDPNNFLIDPTVVFEQVPAPETANIGDTLDPENYEPSVLGGPVLSEKTSSSEDLDILQEYRLNGSFFEALLHDDYLLVERKEFEELEHFLFNDSAEKQGIFFSNISFDEDETDTQPATIDTDMKSLDLLLESQLFNVNNEVKQSCTTNRNNDNLEVASVPRNVKKKDPICGRGKNCRNIKRSKKRSRR